MLSLCDQIKSQLSEKYKNKPVYTYWLGRVHIEETKPLLFTVRTPSRWCETKILPSIKKELSHLLKKKPFQIESIIEEQKGGRRSSLKLSAQPPIQAPNQITAPAPKNPSFLFNLQYSFENFVIGPSNEMAVHCAKKACEGPVHCHFSPLFIYGGSGLGKTHLLHAIGRRIEEKHPHLSLHYLSAEKFLYECVQAIRSDRMDDFRSLYRKSQVLLIDDIQSIEKGPSSQEEFFHTFNAIKEKGGLVVCTCDRLPREIKKMQSRLQTRLAGGLVVDIQAPSFETRMAILQKKAEGQKMNLSSAVIRWLAQNDCTSIRELESLLNKIKMACELQNEAPHLSFIKKILCQEASSKAGFISSVLKQTAKEFDLPIHDLQSSLRTKIIIKARKKAIVALYSHGGLSLNEIGRVFGGKSHSTILNALKGSSKKKKLKASFMLKKGEAPFLKKTKGGKSESFRQ